MSIGLSNSPEPQPNPPKSFMTLPSVSSLYISSVPESVTYKKPEGLI